MYKVLTFLILLIAPVDVLSQVTTQMEIVDDSLGRGENFRFTFSLHNGSDETLEYAGSSSWQVKLEFSDIVELDNSITTDYLTYWLLPGETSTFEFDLSPEELYWPLYDGSHIIYASHRTYKDSGGVKAPAVYGGELNVRYDAVNRDIVQAYKDSLAAEDETINISETSENSGVVYERWSFENLQAERLNQAIKTEDRFIDSWIDRFITFENSVITNLDSQQLDVMPVGAELSQNYPNPFNPSTKIDFTLPQTTDVTLRVYNVLGQQVKTLVNERMSAGSHSARFDATGLSSGMYFYRLQAGDFTAQKQMMLIK